MPQTCRKKKAVKTKKCKSCRNASQNEAKEPEPLVDREKTNSLTTEQKWMIVNLHRDGQKVDSIAKKVSCSKPTVYHWIRVYKEQETVEVPHSNGRKRKTREEEDQCIISVAKENLFVTFSVIKRECCVLHTFYTLLPSFWSFIRSVIPPGSEVTSV